jgi:hypothetical protein
MVRIVCSEIQVELRRAKGAGRVASDRQEHVVDRAAQARGWIGGRVGPQGRAGRSYADWMYGELETRLRYDRYHTSADAMTRGHQRGRGRGLDIYERRCSSTQSGRCGRGGCWMEEGWMMMGASSRLLASSSVGGTSGCASLYAACSYKVGWYGSVCQCPSV